MISYVIIYVSFVLVATVQCILGRRRTSSLLQIKITKFIIIIIIIYCRHYPFLAHVKPY